MQVPISLQSLKWIIVLPVSFRHSYVAKQKQKNVCSIKKEDFLGSLHEAELSHSTGLQAGKSGSLYLLSQKARNLQNKTNQWMAQPQSEAKGPGVSWRVGDVSFCKGLRSRVWPSVAMKTVLCDEIWSSTCPLCFDAVKALAYQVRYLHLGWVFPSQF